jgi:phosphate starvation-inducible PhoH-like protein
LAKRARTIEIRNGNVNGTVRTDRQPKQKRPRDILNSVEPRTDGQKRLLQAIMDNKVTVCDGPAGTGKTLLTTYCALDYYLTSPHNRRIILTRPTILAGDDNDLGMLPGTLIEKMRPFMAPLMTDAAPLLLNSDSFRTNFNHFDRGSPDPMSALLSRFDIEIVPLQFMRGRTFNNCFIILDEAQNCTTRDLKLFMTRIGFGSKMVIEGDSTQTDREDGGHLDGLIEKVRARNSPDIAAVRLCREDIVRDPLVGDILELFDDDH